MLVRLLHRSVFCSIQVSLTRLVRCTTVLQQWTGGVIFDGFPRTIAQAEALKALLNERGQDVTAMIELDVPEDELMDRLLKRGQLSGRADDNEETIKKRLVVYNEQTSPLKEWYKNDGKHCYINGLGELDRIFADIVAAIDSKSI